MADPKTLSFVAPLVEACFAVHWLHPREKRPYGNDWAKRPVATLDKLRETYRRDNNVGVRLGRWSEVAGLYLHVLDIDIRNDDLEDEAFERLERLFPGQDMDRLPMVRSGSGGASRHLYLLTDRAFASKKLAHSATKHVDAQGKKHWDWEIELFGTGKQVAMPPSIHPDTGAPYTWEREFDLDLLDMGVADVFPSELLAGKAMEDAQAEAMAADDEDSLLALARTSPPLGLTEESAWDILRALPLDDHCEDRDGWLKVGMALHHEFEGAEEGFNLWCEFSQQSDRYDPADQERVWKSFRSDRGETITMGFYRKVVQEEGLDFSLCQKALLDISRYRPALLEAAKYELMAAEQEVVIGVLKAKAQAEGLEVGKPAIKRDLNAAHRDYLKSIQADSDARVSIESWLAEETMRVFFAKGDHLMFVAGTPWRYHKGVWSMTDKDFIAHRVWLVIQKLMAGAKGAPSALKDMVQESDRTDFLNALTNAVCGMVVKMQAVDSAQDPLHLNRSSNESVMNCTNVELWFDEGTFEVREHDAANRFTNQVSAVYDPDSESPEWDKALKRLFRDTSDPEGMVRHLHEVMGYLVQSSRDLAAWVLFHGVGANGKSMVTRVLQHLMGPRASVSLDLAELGRDRHAAAGLVGKLMLLEDDFREGAKLPDGIMKKLSESKTLTANPKYGQQFEFVSRASPVVLSNHWPQTSDLSHGLTRRAQVFDFNTVIREEEMDHGLFGRIANNESSGVLNHLIRGWCRVQKRGGFKPPVDCLKARDVWLSNRNALASFLHDHLQVTGDEEDRAAASDVWEAFQFWCMDNNNENRWGRNKFYSKIEQMDGVKLVKPKNLKTFVGVRLVGDVDGLGDDEEEDLIG